MKKIIPVFLLLAAAFVAGLSSPHYLAGQGTTTVVGLGGLPSGFSAGTNQILGPNGTQASPAYTFSNSTNSGLFFEPVGSGFGGLSAIALANSGLVLLDMNSSGVRITDNALDTLFLNTGANTGIKATGGQAIGLLSGNRFKLIDQGSCTMTAGACSAQSLGSTYAAAPVCFANVTTVGGTQGFIRAPSTTTTVTPTSSSAAETSTVNWACLGN